MKNALELHFTGIKCDACDYKNKDVRVEEYIDWLNKPCPKCGANLLTQEDFDTVQILIELASKVNQYSLPVVEDEERIIVSAELNGTGNITFTHKGSFIDLKEKNPVN